MQAQSVRFVSHTGSDTANTCLDEANPCATIEHAISQAGAGDSVIVGIGNYLEPGLVIDKELAIEGAGPELTLIWAPVNDRAMWVASVVTLEALTVRHRSGTGGGIVVESDGVLTLDNVIVRDGVAEEPGGNIFVDGGELTLVDTTVTNGFTDNEHGGGIYNDGGSVTLIGSTVSYNSTGTSTTLAGSGGGIYNAGGGSLTVTDSAFIGNSAFSGGGISNQSGSTATLVDSAIIANQTHAGGGGVSNGGEMSLTGSAVNSNSVGSIFDSGGGIRNAGSLTMIESTVIGNRSQSQGTAGGISNSGDATLTAIIVRENRSGNGGGISNSGTLELVDSTVGDNQAVRDFGGGIYAFSGDVVVATSTISGNTADMGGGIYVRSDGTALVNSTVSGNSAESGGGIAIAPDGALTLINTTVSDNAASALGGGIDSNEADVTLSNTIVAAQQSGGDCGGSEPVSAGHNLDSDGTCGLTEEGDISEGNANLGPLADNGGPTLTHALLEGSDAIDAGDDAVCAADPVNGVDQRGAPRPHGDACDIGAFEFGAAPAAAVIWGDLDCDGNVAIGDALKTARYLLGLSVSQTQPCPEPGADATSDGEPRTWGDVDCDDSVAIGDALKIARWLLGLSVSQEEGCPEIGIEVFISG